MENDVFKEERGISKQPLEVKSFFEIECASGGEMLNDASPYHYHAWYEIYYMKEGRCSYQIGNKSYEIKEGDFILVQPEVSHKLFYSTETHRRILLYFSKDYISLMHMPYVSRLANAPVYSTRPEDLAEAEFILEKLLEEYNNPDEFSETLYSNFLFLLFTMFIRKPTFEVAAKDTELVIEHIVNYIERNYSRKITLEELANIGNLSPNYFSKKFKQVMGIGVSKYIATVRVKHARTLLRETDESVLSVSEKCGFNDGNYFSSVFKEIEGLSPLQYRKNFQL